MELETQNDMSMRERAREFIERPAVTNAILGVIIFNAITLGMSTSQTVQQNIGGVLSVIDRVVLTIFVIELLIKFYAYGWRFFSNAWNIFDLVVVSLGLLPDRAGLSALRGLRVIRALRLLSVIPQMRAVVQALLDALPGMGAVIIMISIVFYVFGVMATLMYGPGFDAWFGTLGRSLYSLFQIMTLESWSMGIVRPVMEQFPYAWAFFITFILVATFTMLNLFIAIIVNAMQTYTDADHQETMSALQSSQISIEEGMHEEIKSLRQEIRELKEMLSTNRQV